MRHLSPDIVWLIYPLCAKSSWCRKTRLDDNSKCVCTFCSEQCLYAFTASWFLCWNTRRTVSELWYGTLLIWLEVTILSNPFTEPLQSCSDQLSSGSAGEVNVWMCHRWQWRSSSSSLSLFKITHMLLPKMVDKWVVVTVTAHTRTHTHSSLSYFLALFLSSTSPPLSPPYASLSFCPFLFSFPLPSLPPFLPPPLYTMPPTHTHRGRGIIVNISSAVQDFPAQMLTSYSASKASLYHMVPKVTVNWQVTSLVRKVPVTVFQNNCTPGRGKILPRNLI